MDDFYELINKMISMHSKARDVLIKYRDAGKFSTKRIDDHLQEDLRILQMNIENKEIIIEQEEKEDLKLIVDDLKQVKSSLDEITRKDRWVRWLAGILVALITVLGLVMTYLNKLGINELIKEMKQEMKNERREFKIQN